MRLSGLTVCVNYSDLFKKSIERWVVGLEHLVVVTNYRDEETEELVTEYFDDICCIQIYKTDIFYANGAVFNKARAICEAVVHMDWMDDWQLLFDSDIIPPKDWREVVERHQCVPGYLYGARRITENGELYPEGELAGYFQLFHSKDIFVQRYPLLEIDWRHAGGYDSEFHGRWPNENKIFLPMNVIHQGEPGRNWWGRGKVAEMNQMLVEREKVKGIWEQEKIQRS